MFTKYSMAGVGWLTVVLSYVLAYLGVNADSSQIAAWADNIIAVVGLIMIIIGQLRRKDLHLGLWRK